MTAKRKFKSEAFEAIHSSASAMFRVGAIDKATMRDFDETCLAVTPAIAPRRSSDCAKPTMSASRSSPATSTPAKARWKSGNRRKKPSGAALKLLAIVQKHGLEILA